MECNHELPGWCVMGKERLYQTSGREKEVSSGPKRMGESLWKKQLGIDLNIMGNWEFAPF